ncbi:putative quinol monooxygenase [Nocardia huaxiensis]|uniref:Antibiotic biosynthesis monooxygenase n=1 Tax=Nocardia huaxiensis TaxID=2755382 RepID=A0A7D6VPQ8_9NOCA|nr:antibiotic biosynthesis monooxygenase [Nocardia huaxiensis]
MRGARVEQARKEAGTLLYVLNRSTDDQHLFWVTELYSDEKAFAAHRDSAAMASASPVLSELIAEAEVLVGEPVRSKGMPEG